MADIKSLQRLLHSTARKLEFYKDEMQKSKGAVPGKLTKCESELVEEMDRTNKEMSDVIAKGFKADPYTKQKILNTITFLERNKELQETAAKMQAALFGETLFPEFSDNLTRVAKSLKRGERVEDTGEAGML